MSPMDQIAELYRRFPQPRTFAEDQLANIVNGYVISRKDFFIMGRAVRRGHPEVANPWHRFSDPDCWFIQAAAIAQGISQNIFLTLIPFSLRWVAFAREDGPIRYYESARLCSTLTRFSARSSTA